MLMMSKRVVVKNLIKLDFRLFFRYVLYKMNCEDYDYLFKLLLIGDSGIGKSCLLMKYVDNIYQESYISTIGVDFKIKTINIDGKGVKMQIWDTAGQERFRTITSSYYRGAQGIAIVFDLTDVDSFHNVVTWMDEVKKHNNCNPVLILVGTKFDMVGKKPETDVKYSDIISFIEEYNMIYIPTSAKTGQGVDQMFTSVCKKLLENHIPIKKSGTIVISPGKKINERKSCC